MRFLLAIFTLILSLGAFAIAQDADLPTTDGLTIKRIREGEGEAKITPGDQVAIHYVGTLMDGTQFDSSYQREDPLQFTAGAGQVIKGWDVGIMGMKIGEKRKLTIAPHLAYGAKGAGHKIPPHATINFVAKCVGINGKGWQDTEDKDEL